MKPSLNLHHKHRYGFEVRPMLEMLEETYWQYIDHFTMIGLRLFNYEGLPNGIKATTIEEQLFYNGKCVITKHPETEHVLVLPCETFSQNAMGQPTKFKAYSYSSKDRKKLIIEGKISLDGKDGDGVVISNNYLDKPTYGLLDLWARRLAEIDVTIDQNIFAMRQPFILVADEDNENSVKLFFSKYTDFEPVVVVKDKKENKKKNMVDLVEEKRLDERMNVLQLGVEDRTATLEDAKQEIINWIYTMFNINNGVSRKKERMIVDEVNINNEQIELVQNISLVEREEAIELANKLFGLNIKVERSVENEPIDISEVHNNDQGSSKDLPHGSVSKKV